MPLVHQHGPCQPFKNTNKPSHAQILEKDRARVARIHGHGAESLSVASVGGTGPIRVPDQAGGAFGTGNYIIQVGLGTPPAFFSVVFDTGSDVSWIQCAPCGTSCYKQQDPLFDPSNSTTYSSLLCSSNECQKLDSQSRTCLSTTSTCHYKVQYGDNSKTEGNFVKDTLTMGQTKIPNFLFGCGNDNNGLFGSSAGLIGLGRGTVSLVSQLSSKYRAFSYCLPSTSDTKGYLQLGGKAPKSTKYTSMVTNSQYPSFYFVNLIGIAVGGQVLPVSQTVFSNAGTLLDSGTVITRLPPTAYQALRDKFQSLMTSYKKTQPLSILDTCYDFTGFENSTVSVPSITLKFSGGTNLDVDFSGILYVADFSQACLAFAPYNDNYELAIVGNVQQRRYNVMYDVSKQKIGFAPKAC